MPILYYGLFYSIGTFVSLYGWKSGNSILIILGPIIVVFAKILLVVILFGPKLISILVGKFKVNDE